MRVQARIARYEVVSELGQGPLGTVYKAVDPLTKHVVAIETIDPALSNEEPAVFKERFYREASAGRLSHANIVTIHEAGETDDIAYIAMEYLEGKSLRETLDSGVVLPIERIASIAARVADALNYAHENHVVHCGVKPANIMITPDDGVKVRGFGMARFATASHMQPGAVPETLGSLEYLAPEQVAGGNTDGRTDVFALGVVLYEMLAGVPPFNGEDPGAIIHKLLKEEPVPPGTLDSRVPPTFDRIVGRALAKRPRDRYQSALELAGDLRTLDAATPREVRRVAAGPRPAEPVPVGKAPVRGASVNRERIEKGTTSLLGKAWGRTLLLALPLLIVAAFVVYSQGDPPHRDELAASTTPAVTAMPVTAETPVIPAAAAAPAASTVAATPAVSTTPRVSARPGVSARPRVALPPRVAATPRVPESESVPLPTPVTPPKATVTFAISPWGEVYVDGNNVGVSPPLAKLQLASGEHQVEIRNQAFEPYRDTVSLEPGKSLKIRHKFK